MPSFHECRVFIVISQNSLQPNLKWLRDSACRSVHSKLIQRASPLYYHGQTENTFPFNN